MKGFKGWTEADLVLGLDLAGSPRRPTGALVGSLFQRGEAEVYGNFAEGAIIMPKDAGKLRGNKK
jgi:hypothetical protein